MEPKISIESVLDALREVVRTYAGAGERDAPVVRRALAVQRGPIDEVWAALPPRCVRPAIQMMVKELGIWHLSTITASDVPAPDTHVPAGIEVIYHFWLGCGLSLRCTLPYEDPQLDSVRDLVPGAAFYEREVAEMLGIAYRPPPGDTSPAPGRLLLPDDWEGGAPLRHDFEAEQDV